MSSSGTGVVIPSSLEHVLASIADFSEDQFRLISEAINAPEGLSADKERCERLAAQIGVPTAAIGYLFGGLNFLYSAMPGASEEGSSPEKGLNNILEDMDFSEHESKVSKIKARISSLLVGNDNLLRYKKIVRLKEGFVRNASSFSSFVDLRPYFNDERSSISSLIPLIQFRILTDSDIGLERQIVFQMDRKALRRLREAVDYATRKLDAIYAADFLAGKIDDLDRS